MVLRQHLQLSLGSQSNAQSDRLLHVFSVHRQKDGTQRLWIHHNMQQNIQYGTANTLAVEFERWENRWGSTLLG